MSPIRTMVLSLRVPEDIAEDLRAVAFIKRVSVSRASRNAIEAYLAKTVSDPEFQKEVRKRLKDDMKESQQLAARLTR